MTKYRVVDRGQSYFPHRFFVQTESKDGWKYVIDFDKEFDAIRHVDKLVDGTVIYERNAN